MRCHMASQVPHLLPALQCVSHCCCVFNELPQERFVLLQALDTGFCAVGGSFAQADAEGSQVLSVLAQQLIHLSTWNTARVMRMCLLCLTLSCLSSIPSSSTNLWRRDTFLVSPNAACVNTACVWQRAYQTWLSFRARQNIHAVLTTLCLPKCLG